MSVKYKYIKKSISYNTNSVYLEKCFEVMHIVEAPSNLHIFEKTHPEDSENEHDEEKEKTDVQESRE